MIKKLEWHIILSIVSPTLVVLLALQSIGILIEVIAAADDVGEKNYTLVTLVQYVLGYSSIKMIQFFPISLLIGALIGLGKVASSNELTVMQVSGISRMRIGIIGTLVSFVLGIGALLVNEFVCVPAYQYAVNLRLTALNLPNNQHGSNGIWVHSNDSFVNIKGLLSNGLLSGVSIYTLNEEMSLKTIKTAKTVNPKNYHWELSDVTEKQITADKINISSYSKDNWENNLDKTVITLLLSDPEDLSVMDLKRYISYQEANDIKPTRYALTFWKRLLVPLSTGVMFLLALPFVFGSQRSIGQGKKLFLGVLLGLSYFIVSTSISNIILLTGAPVLLGAILPIILFALMSFILLRVRG